MFSQEHVTKEVDSKVPRHYGEENPTKDHPSANNSYKTTLAIMSPPRILVSGASVAGPALAYWLVKAGCKVTIVERSRVLRTEGQGIDVRDSARDVIRKMGIFDIMRERSSQEEGVRVFTAGGKTLAAFGADLESGNANSFSCDIEILRGELAGILYDITKDDVEYVFGDYVKSLEETEKDVTVTFANGLPNRTFDLLIAADGIGSKIRGMISGKSYSKAVKSLNSYVSYFSIPKLATEDKWAELCWREGGRSLWLRPDNVGRTRVFLMTVAYSADDKRLDRYAEVCKSDIPAQKALTKELFQDFGWQVDRVLEGMEKSDDFYMQHVAQTRIDKWTSPMGRVGLVGDAAACPSPFTGMGTSLAFIESYIMAGEISKQLDDLPAALIAYEKVVRPYVEDTQNLFPGIPWILNPQTSWGLGIFQSVIGLFGFIAGTRVAAVVNKIVDSVPKSWFGSDFKLPHYKAFEDKE